MPNVFSFRLLAVIMWLGTTSSVRSVVRTPSSIRVVTYNVAGENDDWGHRKGAMKEALFPTMERENEPWDLQVFHLQESKAFEPALRSSDPGAKDDRHQMIFFRELIQEGVAENLTSHGSILDGRYDDIQSLGLIAHSTFRFGTFMPALPAAEYQGSFASFNPVTTPLDGSRYRRPMLTAYRSLRLDTLVFFVNMHLDWGPEERRNRQVVDLLSSRLIDMIKPFAPSISDDFMICPDLNIIVSGDLNGNPSEEWYSQMIRAGFQDVFEDFGSDSGTFPSSRAHNEGMTYARARQDRLDYIFYLGKNLRVNQISRRLVGDQPSGGGDKGLHPSDHIGLEVTFQLVDHPPETNDRATAILAPTPSDQAFQAHLLSCVSSCVPGSCDAEGLHEAVPNYAFAIWNAGFSNEYMYARDNARYNSNLPQREGGPRDVYTWKESHKFRQQKVLNDIKYKALKQAGWYFHPEVNDNRVFRISVTSMTDADQREYLCADVNSPAAGGRIKVGVFRDASQHPHGLWIVRPTVADSGRIWEISTNIDGKDHFLYAQTKYEGCDQERRNLFLWPEREPIQGSWTVTPLEGC